MTQIVIEMPACAGCCEISSGMFYCRQSVCEGVLCGYSEYAPNGSGVPAKYGTQTYNEDYNNCSYSGAGCATDSFGTTKSVVINGTGVYNADCSTETVNGTRNFGGTTETGGTCVLYGGALTNSQPSTEAGFNDLSFTIAGFSKVTGVTKVEFTGTEVCTNIGINSNILEGTRTWELSDQRTSDPNEECTDPTDWTLSPEDCEPQLCCETTYSVAPDFSYTTVNAEWKIDTSGLLPSTLYFAEVQYWRFDPSGGVYVLFQTDMVSGTTDGSGNLVITEFVPTDTSGGQPTYARLSVIPHT